MGDPLCEATVTIGGSPAAVGAEQLWRLREDVPTPDGPIAVDQSLSRLPDGSFRLESTSGHALAVDGVNGTVTVDGRDDAVRSLLLTTFAIPLLLHDAPALILHAAACQSAAGAVVFCGASGRGKSSAVAGLVDIGWPAVSEDLCVFDMRHDPPLVWPGPPWVRRAHGLPGPIGADMRFQSPDKVAWDIADRVVDGPVPLAELVFLEPPGGEVVEQLPVSRGDAVGRVADAAYWLLGDSETRGRFVFERAVDLANAVPASSVRLPVSDDWLARMVDLFASA